MPQRCKIFIIELNQTNYTIRLYIPKNHQADVYKLQFILTYVNNTETFAVLKFNICVEM
jgi:hypothetical protein